MGFITPSVPFAERCIIRMKKVANNKLLIFWVIFACIIGILGACQATLLNNDDVAYMQNFINEKMKFSGGGVERTACLKAILSTGMNADVLADSGDFRTYGLSRMLHVIIMLLGNNSPAVYQFIIGFTHVLSGYLIYILLKELGFEEGISCCSGLLWAMSPFARVQTFHHWSYLMLPLYLLLLFFLYIERTIGMQVGNEDKISWKKYLQLIVVMLCVIFTGEYTLVPLFFSLFLLAIIYKVKKENRLSNLFSILLFTGIAFLMLYVIVYQLFINRSSAHRFSLLGINIWRGLCDFGRSIIFAVKSFLYLPNMYTELYPSQFNRNSLRYLDWRICGIVIFLSLIVFVYGMYCLYRGKGKCKNRSRLILVSIVGVSFSGIYILMEIAMGQGMLPTRYFYSLLTILFVLIFVCLAVVFPKCRYMVFGIEILMACTSMIVYMGILLPENKVINEEIISKIDEAEQEGYNNIVFLNVEGIHSGVLTPRQSYRADNPFDWGWVTYILIKDKYNFENIIFLKQGDTIQEIDEKEILLHNSYSYDEREVVIEKDKSFFVGLTDLEYNNGKDRIPQRGYYYGYEELRNSQYYRGIEAVAMGEQVESNFYHTLGREAWTQEEVYWINCGVSDRSGRYKEDNRAERNGEMICGGYVEIGNRGYGGGDGAVNNYFSTYRYGEEFSYQFFNIPSDNEYILAFDIYENFKKKTRTRIFDVKIETDKNSFVVEDIDVVAIAGNKDVPVRILIHLPECKWVKATFLKDDKGLDVPYINGIGILRKTRMTDLFTDKEYDELKKVSDTSGLQIESVGDNGRIQIDKNLSTAHIYGWAVDPLKEDAAKEIFMRVKGRNYRGTWVYREDLRAVNENYTYSGFEFYIPVDEINGETDVIFNIISKDASYRYEVKKELYYIEQ